MALFTLFRYACNYLSKVLLGILNNALADSLYALVLVGGRGERLKPLTNDIPKPLVPVNGVPLLRHHTRMLVRNGVTDVVFLCGYKGEKVKEAFGDGTGFGFRAHYNIEEKPLGRGGAFKVGLGLVPKDAKNVIATNGDIFSDQHLGGMFALHNELRFKATAMLVPHPSQYGVVNVAKDGHILEFAEKKPLSVFINAGIYIFNRDLYEDMPDRGDHETTTFPSLVKKRLLGGFKSDRLWFSVENMKDLREAEERLSLISWLGG